MASFRTFFALYCLFLAPLLVSLATFLFAEDHSVEHIAVEPVSFKITAFWMAVVVVSYFGNNWILYLIGGTTRDIAPAQRKEDLLRLLMMQLPVLVMGRVGNRLETHPYIFLGAYIYFGAFYTLLYESQGALDIVVTPQTLRHNKYALLIVMLTSTTILLTLHHHLVYGHEDTELIHFGMLFVGALLILLLLPASFFIPHGKIHTTHVHLHHWFWPVPMALMCSLRTTPSLVASAMFLSCSLHGVATFGFHPCFNSTKRPVNVHSS